MNPRSPESPRDPAAGALGTRAQSPIGTPTILKCPACGSAVQPELPFCGSCGGRITSVTNALACPNCGRLNDPTNAFCPACGTAIGTGIREPKASTPPQTATKPTDRTASLLLLDRAFKVTNKYLLHGALTTVGRQGADINFPDDALPLSGACAVRDDGRDPLGAGPGQPQRHLGVPGAGASPGGRRSDPDREPGAPLPRLGYPGPRPPEQDQTRRLGSLTPSADIANLAQIRADGSARDIVHLSPGRSSKLGREQGDWQFPYDASMSAHARQHPERGRGLRARPMPEAGTGSRWPCGASASCSTILGCW